MFYTFGENVVTVYCDNHGAQKVSKTYRADKLKEARKLRRIYGKQVEKASTMTLDQLMKTDKPGF